MIILEVSFGVLIGLTLAYFLFNHIENYNNIKGELVHYKEYTNMWQERYKELKDKCGDI